jgi:photosystem II stability/assembly factor-like uncharacterized protein
MISGNHLFSKWNIGILSLLCATSLLFSGCSSSSTAEWVVRHKGEVPHSPAVTSVFFLDENQGWALTWAELFKVRDHGTTWDPILTNDGGHRAFYSLTFMSASTGIIVGTQEKEKAYTVLILKTSDGGDNWQEAVTDVRLEVDRDKRPSINSVAFCDARNGWAVGPNLILHTIDGGAHWVTQRRNADEEMLNAIGCVNSKQAWAVGARGLILKTKDGGDTWIRQEIDTDDTLMKVRFVGDNGWIVGGTNGKALLFRSTDRGENWQLQRQDVAAMLLDIVFTADQGWIAGENGTILRSDDGGETWVQRQVPTNENLTCLFFLSSDNGWAAGDRMTLLRLSK